ncbi:nuclease-related domain-containing protein [Bacillus sp. KH172YL63]|uniref:nuclease-related domain-containing protein n=1 Tax=Bacillus sp. KH172YL63 TaxID=2709784 RepID=UPI0013E4D335|nr:nuclease-related domain-containing protein [Bacillus sp. KH172YL63]BCB04208.1 nuclease [Bacillus sp. KH172YL63]
MIAKERETPQKLVKTEALIRRLQPLNHPKRPIIEQDLKKRKAGFNGEKAVDYHLSFLSDKKYMIFNDLKLPMTPDFFQIDTLLLTSHYTLPIEVKNISGTLTINPEFNQFSKIYQGIETGYPDPITQARRQKLFLQRWFYNQKLPCPPIEFLVVFSNPATILKMAKGHALIPPFDKIIHAQNLVNEISKLNQKYSQKEHEPYDLKKIKRLLLTQHQEDNSSILQTYQLNAADIRRGVLCERCNEVMIRMTGFWHCPFCQHGSKTAHLQAIKDYFLLIKPTITNQELRDFLLLPSRKTATIILQSLPLTQIGNRKGVYYIQSP